MNTTVEATGSLLKPFSARSRSSVTSRERLERERRAAKVEEFMPLIRKIANRVFSQINGRIEHEELVGFGITGLLEAMDRFVPGGDATLATFAYYRIRGAMLDGIGSVAPLSRKGYRYAQAAGDKHAIYREALESDMIVDPRDNVSPEDLMARSEVHERLSAAISNLSDEQQHLVREHYFSGSTLQDAGKALGISKSWASRAHASALRNLRGEMRSIVSCAA